MVSQAGNKWWYCVDGMCEPEGWVVCEWIPDIDHVWEIWCCVGSMVSLRRYSFPNPYPFWNFTDLNNNSHPPSSAECKYSSTALSPSPESESSGPSPARRNRFIPSASLGICFANIVQPSWFSHILGYSGPNIHLQGFEHGLNLIVEAPFIVAAVIVVFLNLVLPREGSEMDRQVKVRDEAGNPVLERREEGGD